jgi:hypothetical protein
MPEGVPVPEDRNSGEIFGSKASLARAPWTQGAEAAEAHSTGGAIVQRGPEDASGPNDHSGVVPEDSRNAPARRVDSPMRPTIF